VPLEVLEEFQLFQQLHLQVEDLEVKEMLQAVVVMVDLVVVAVELLLVVQETHHLQLQRKVKMVEMVVQALKVHKVIVAAVAVVLAQ
jgi:hypothetical protein